MKIIFVFLMGLICIQLFACSRNNEVEQTQNSYDTSNTDIKKMKITIGSTVFTATLYNNATATAFRARMPMTINMTELNGNEKYFDLRNDLESDALNPGTIQTGDLMLYGANTLVLFYKTFTTSYNYTRLARIDNASSLADALGSGNITVKFELE